MPQKRTIVHFISWENGYHIYAKVDGEDVVDAEGNQKWSNMKEAEKAVKWYIEEKINYENK